LCRLTRSTTIAKTAASAGVSPSPLHVGIWITLCKLGSCFLNFDPISFESDGGNATYLNGSLN
jgi:hypothetical protein